MFSHQTSDIAVLAPEHDNRHSLDQSEFARESLAFIIQVPEAGIGGFLYTWVNGAGRAGAALCLFGEALGPEPIFDIADDIPVSAEMDFFNWQVGGLTLQLQAPLQTALVTYQTDAVEVKYQFIANHQAYAYSTHSNGCPQWMADDRFEQQGTIQGFIKSGDKHIPFDGLSLRDHSWGTRDWAVNQHWKWVHVQAGHDLGVHFWKLFALGREHLCGYVNRDGHLAQVVSVCESFSCTEGLRPKSVSAEVTDSAGRVTSLSAETYGTFPFKVHELITLFECPMTATIEGKPGNGWMEMMWPNDLIGSMKDRAI
jgi:hypothetical protein